jgi:hypothetical protein
MGPELSDAAACAPSGAESRQAIARTGKNLLVLIAEEHTTAGSRAASDGAVF